MDLSVSPISSLPPLTFSSAGAALAPTVRLVQSLDELTNLEADWKRLSETSVSGPFQSFAWNLAWYRHFESAYDEMLVFRLEERDQVTAILPLYRKGRSLCFAGDNVGDHQDLIASDSHTAELILRKALRWAKERGFHLHLLQVREQAWAYQALRRLNFSNANCFRYQRCYSACPILQLPDSLEAYLKALPRKLRGDLKRHLNKAKREYPDAEVEIFRAGGIDADLIDEVATFHRTHFRKNGVSLLSSQNFISLLTEASQDPDSGIRVSTLRNGEKLMAIDVGFTFSGVYHGYLTAFDPEYRSISPGNVMLLKRIDWMLKEDQVQAIDFLLGAERYKASFTEERYQVCSFYVFPANPANAVRWFWKRAYFGSKYIAKWLLNKSGVANYSI